MGQTFLQQRNYRILDTLRGQNVGCCIEIRQQEVTRMRQRGIKMTVAKEEKYHCKSK